MSGSDPHGDSSLSPGESDRFDASASKQGEGADAHRHPLPAGETGAGDELFDVCDEHDNVLRQATRADVHANHWIHRAVHIWVFRSDGSLLLHRRSATKDTCPLKITSSASGHVDAGETYHECAVRELQEELGLTADLEELTKLPPGPLTAWEHSQFYRCTTDADPVPDPGEIAEVMTHTMDEWAALIAENELDFAPVFIELWNWYRAKS